MFLSILRSDENEGAFKLLFKLKISLISDFTNADLNSFFAELMDFLIEVAKNDAVLAVNETMANQVFAVIINNSLQYDLTAATTSFSSMEVFDVLGKKVLQQKVTETKGEVSVVNLASGIYISKFTSNNGTSVSKKLLKK